MPYRFLFPSVERDYRRGKSGVPKNREKFGPQRRFLLFNLTKPPETNQGAFVTFSAIGKRRWRLGKRFFHALAHEKEESQ